MSKYKKDEMTNKRKNKNGDEDMASSSEDEIKMEVPQGTNLDN